MNRIIKLLLLLLIVPGISFACEIFINVDGAQKQKYKAGDIIVIKIRVEKKHRNCSVDIKDTKINVAGLQIVGATDWVQTQKNMWDRKLKVRIVPVKNKKATISVLRECDRDGGRGDLALQIE